MRVCNIWLCDRIVGKPLDGDTICTRMHAVYEFALEQADAVSYVVYR